MGVITAAQIAGKALSAPNYFSRTMLHMPLRRYQIEAAQAIVDDVRHRKGSSIVVMMSRQAGKNELSAHIEAYLLTIYRNIGGEMVKASPTFKPQTERSMIRLEERLSQSPWLSHIWLKRLGYIYAINRASIAFLSADPSASIVGGTASLLLEVDEAQDVNKQKYYKDLAPMRASMNATAVFWGTSWTSRTLLFEQMQEAKHRKTLYKYPWDLIAEENPHYGQFVQNEIARLGENHPIIRTQYKLQEIDAEGKFLNPARLALLRSTHARQREPVSNHLYALLIDVAGEDEGASDRIVAQREDLTNKRRDATTVTVIEVIIPNPGAGYTNNALKQPIYLVRDRRAWYGVKHSVLHQQICALIEHWRARYVVVDATGVGAGLYSFLSKSYPDRVIGFEFSSVTKSNLGWSLIALIETGRLKDYADDHEPETRQFWYEAQECEYQVSDGPGQVVKWGVWEAPAYDGVIARGHDDFIVGLALTAVLEEQTWSIPHESTIIPYADPLTKADREKVY